MDYSRFLSRKFIVALVTMVVLALGLAPELADKIVAIAMMYLGAQGAVDAVSGLKKK